MSFSTPLKQPIVSGDRDRLLAEDLRIEQSTTAVKQLPMVLIANSVWALVYCITVGRYRSWPFFLSFAMALLLAPILLYYRKMKSLPRPTSITRLQIEKFTIYSGLLGILWSSNMIVHLPSLPLQVLIFLTIGCTFLIVWGAAVVYAVPSASAAYSVPIFLAAIYIGASISEGTWSILTTLVFLMTGSAVLINIVNVGNFIAGSRVIAERAQFLTASRAAVVAKNQFLENVSHEIKTPLTTVVGYTKLLVAQKSNMLSEHGETLEHLDISAATLLKNINALLDITKLNAGQLPIQEEVFDLQSLIHRLLKSIKNEAAKKDIQLEHDFSSEIPALLVGDAQRIEQIISSLLDNAVKFTQSGRIRVAVSCEHPESPLGNNKMLCIAVSDTGIGIEALKRVLIFRSFYQADGSVTRSHGGMGLGLTVSRMLANLMRGDLNFENDVDGGSTFKCWLPLKLELKNVHRESFPLPKSRIRDEPWHILVVDDDAYIRHYLQMLLSTAGWVVELCESGFSAVALSSKRKYDLILIDIQMPAMTGIDASKIIRSIHRNEDTPILAMTGYLSTDRIVEMRAAGLIHYMGKPLAPDELLAKARHLVMSSFCADGESVSSDPAWI